MNFQVFRVNYFIVNYCDGGVDPEQLSQFGGMGCGNGSLDRSNQI